MNNQLLTYGVLGIIAVYFLIIYVIPFFRKAKRTTPNIAPKVHKNSHSSLTGEQYRKLALGAIYSEQQGGYINSLETGIDKENIITLLSKWWGINGTSDSLSTLEYLADKGFRFYFPVIYKAFLNPNQQKIILESFSEEEDIEKAYSQLINLQETFDELKADQIIRDAEDIRILGDTGWDCGRLVFLSRLCYDAGYISQQQAWHFIDRADQISKQVFTSWEQYAKSYVLGRAIWGGKAFPNNCIVDIYRYLFELPNSPFIELRW